MPCGVDLPRGLNYGCLDMIRSGPDKIVLTRDVQGRILDSFNNPMTLTLFTHYNKPSTMKITKTNTYELGTKELLEIVTDHLKAKGLLDKNKVLDEKTTVAIKSGGIAKVNGITTITVRQEIGEAEQPQYREELVSERQEWSDGVGYGRVHRIIREYDRYRL